MAVTLKGVHKAAVLGWSTHNDAGALADNIRGHEASLVVELHDGSQQEKRTVINDGEANLFFPADYSGQVTVTVRGSRGGEDTGTLTIP